MAINIYTVQSDALSYGWEVLSEKYTNLKTPMEWKCPKGHITSQTYEDWRKFHRCPECEKSDRKIVRNQLVPPTPGCHRVLALDAATGTTGWAIFDDKKLTSYGTFTTDITLSTTERINCVKKWLAQNLQVWKPNAVGIENIQYQQQRGVKTFQVLANLQGVLVDYLFENGYDYLVAGSSTWRSFVGLNHADARTTAKKVTQDWVSRNYHITPTQDEADAIAMGVYFSHQLYNKKNTQWGEEIY